MKNIPVKIRLAVLAGSLVAAVNSHAVGTGAIVPGSGSGSISKDGNTATVTQTTNKLIVNWDNMDVARNETLNFVQRSSTAAVLNRVNSANPTSILGTLNGNGRVFIVNPNGVVIGPTGKVNVGALFASSLNITDDDFKANRLNFSGGGQGRVANNGKITARESVALLGSKTVENLGTITSSGGDVLLASADDIALDFSDSHLTAEYNKGSLDATVRNSGSIKTDDGDIRLTAWARDWATRSVINNTGTLEASSLSRDVWDRPLYGIVSLQTAFYNSGPSEIIAGGLISGVGAEIRASNVTLDGILLSDSRFKIFAKKMSTTDSAWVEVPSIWYYGSGEYDWSHGTRIYTSNEPNIVR
ncbi:filamentous hemagglutinin N-terminal domain-containing protein [Trinickia sp. YCB016]